MYAIRSYYDATRELQRLRGIFGRVESGSALPPAISEVWYELTTQRIDSYNFV